MFTGDNLSHYFILRGNVVFIIENLVLSIRIII